MKILVVEDEPPISRIIEKVLSRSGHLVDTIFDGLEAKERLDSYDYDILILDIMLPGADGPELCKYARSIGLNAKILMLTARDDIDSKVACLNLGADDYMTKPFSLEELEARVRALGRREKSSRMDNLVFGSLVLNLETKVATVNKKKLKTTLTEFRILEYLMRRKGSLCTRTMLEENIWGNKQNLSNVITATISKLRSKIKKLNDGRGIIQAVPQSGYRLSLED
jgi:DNA-binding response OmpR family regulator